MTGSVVNLHAILPVTLRLPGRGDLVIDFVVDTGFTGFLTLSPPAIAALSLPFLENIPANLADDSEIKIAVHAATILWNGFERRFGFWLQANAPFSEPLCCGNKSSSRSLLKAAWFP